MTRVSGTDIAMTRGDSLFVQVSITNAGTAYTPAEGDEIKFFLKHNVFNALKTDYRDRTPLIAKTIPNNTLVLELSPEDTKELDFGEYVYDIQIKFANGNVDTFVNNAGFTILPEVG